MNVNGNFLLLSWLYVSGQFSNCVVSGAKKLNALSSLKITYHQWQTEYTALLLEQLIEKSFQLFMRPNDAL